MNLRHALRLLKAAKRAAGRGGAGRSGADAAAAGHRAHRVSPGAAQIANSDAEFSRSSIAERRAAGYRDMQAALAAEPWLRQEMPAHLGALVHRVEQGTVTTRPELPICAR